MSQDLMDTEPGGEQTQYEGIATNVQPHKKSSGQLGSGSETTSTDSQPDASARRQAERGAQTAENIRYGQGISEGGMGGQTTTSGGEAAQGGYGRVGGAEGGEGAEGRGASGYGGEREMDREVGG